MPIQNAFDCWISPAGNIIPLYGHHIDTIMETPEAFGWTKEEVQEVFDKYNEPMGLEGKARDELLISAWKKGWIRVNYDMRADAFLMNVWTLSDRVRGNLETFANTINTVGVYGKTKSYSDVVITIYSTQSMVRTSLSQLRQGHSWTMEATHKRKKVKGQVVWERIKK